MSHRPPRPGQPAPALKVRSLQGGSIDLAEQNPDHFSLVFFYRGVHCPICKAQLEELNERLDDFEKRGLAVLAVSMDDEDRARRQAQEWSVGRLPIGYAMSADQAREWGLFLSRKEKDSEPDLFSEPGLAVVYPDGRLYALSYQSMPFARPQLDDILKGLAFIIKNDYPVRGTVAA